MLSEEPGNCSIWWSVPQYLATLPNHLEIKKDLMQQLAEHLKDRPSLDGLLILMQWNHQSNVDWPQGQWEAFETCLVEEVFRQPTRLQEVLAIHSSDEFCETVLVRLLDEPSSWDFEAAAKALAPFDHLLAHSSDVSLGVALSAEYGQQEVLWVLSQHLPQVLTARIDASLGVLSTLKDGEQMFASLKGDPNMQSAILRANDIMLDIQMKTLLSFFPFMDDQQNKRFVRTCLDNNLSIPPEIAAAVSKKDLLDQTAHLASNSYKIKKM